MKADEREAWTKKIDRDALLRAQPKRSKYGAVKTDAGGRRYDSAKEAKRGLELAMLQAAGEISDLKLQQEFPIEIRRAGTYNGEPPRVKVASYFADFTYRDKGGAFVVEDVKSKGTRTAVYALKRKLVEALYGLTITET